MNKPIAAILLLLRFFAAVMTAGLNTVSVIIRNALGLGTPPQGGFVRFRFAPMSAQGAALLGSMVSLTPGTTIIEVDLDKHEMIAHMLDITRSERMIGDIRRHFEPGLVTLFGAKP